MLEGEWLYQTKDVNDRLYLEGIDSGWGYALIREHEALRVKEGGKVFRTWVWSGIEKRVR